MAFSNFPEQSSIVTLLRRSLENGRLAHAYLFSGGALGEMEDLARTLAKTLNCASPPSRAVHGQPLDSCDHCANCRRIDSGNHPDVQWSRPGSKMRLITIDQMREVIEVISLKPTEAHYKMAIIVAADRLTTQAANAFLKTLEEPPGRAVLILLTTNIDQVLETILSRCLRLHFAGEPGVRMSAEDQQWLQAMVTMAGEPRKSLLGRYRLLSVITNRLRAVKEQITEQMEAASPLSRFPDAEKEMRERWEDELNAAIESEYRRRRADLLLLLQWWMRDIWLNSMRLANSEPALPLFGESTSRLAARVSAEQAAENVRALDRLQRQLQQTNVQETLALEIGLLKLAL